METIGDALFDEWTMAQDSSPSDSHINQQALPEGCVPCKIKPKSANLSDKRRSHTPDECFTFLDMVMPEFSPVRCTDKEHEACTVEGHSSFNLTLGMDFPNPLNTSHQHPQLQKRCKMAKSQDLNETSANGQHSVATDANDRHQLALEQ